MKKFYLSTIAFFAFSCCYCQTRGISFAGGVNWVGEHKLNGIGYDFSAFFPLNKNSQFIHEIKTDFSYNTMPPNTTLTGYPKLQITCIEADYRFGYDFGIVYFQIGAGINYNFVNGGINVNDKIILPDGKTSYNSFKNVSGIGIGLNIGLGVYIIPKLAIYAEYSAQSIFGKAETSWGGLRFGLRYFPWRVKD